MKYYFILPYATLPIGSFKRIKAGFCFTAGIIEGVKDWGGLLARPVLAGGRNKPGLLKEGRGYGFTE